MIPQTMQGIFCASASEERGGPNRSQGRCCSRGICKYTSSDLLSRPFPTAHARQPEHLRTHSPGLLDLMKPRSLNTSPEDTEPPEAKAPKLSYPEQRRLPWSLLRERFPCAFRRTQRELSQPRILCKEPTKTDSVLVKFLAFPTRFRGERAHDSKLFY